MSLSLAISGLGLPVSAISATMAIFLAPYYASPGIGLDIGLVGMAFMLARLIDGPADFVLGMAMDRTRTRWGRFRVWVIVGAPITCLAVYMLFFAPPGVSMSYLLVWLIILSVGASVLSLAQIAWGATLARTYDARSKLYGMIAAVGALGSGVVLAAPSVIGLVIPGAEVGLKGVGWVILLCMPLFVGLALLRTPEPTPAARPADHQIKLGAFWTLLARPSMGRVVAADFFFSLGVQWVAALYMFFMMDSRGFTANEARWLFITYGVAGLAGAPLIGRLATAVSKHRAILFSIVGWGLVLLTLMLTPKANVWVGGVQMFTLGAFGAGFMVLTRAMTADVADEIHLEQGHEQSGMLFAFTVFIMKVASALAIGLSYLVLAALAYRSGVPNAPEAVRGLELTFIVIPALLIAIAALCLRGYPLTRERHAEIRRQLDLRDAAATDALETPANPQAAALGR